MNFKKLPKDRGFEDGRMGLNPNPIIDPIKQFTNVDPREIIQYGNDSRRYRTDYVRGLLEFVEVNKIPIEDYNYGISWV